MLLFSLLLGLAHAQLATRINMTNAVARGALCLDGSPAGYYWRPGSLTDKFILFFEGGGWCNTELDCFGRSSTALGSSRNWPATKGGGGLLSSDCTKSHFCNYNLVYMAYCGMALIWLKVCRQRIRTNTVVEHG